MELKSISPLSYFYAAWVVLFFILERIFSLRSEPASSRREWINIGAGILAYTLSKWLISISLLSLLPPVPWKGWDEGKFYAIPLLLFFFDGWMWLQHFLFHRISWPWKWHQWHHRDPHLDLTTSWRFHPIEILLSFHFKLLFYWLCSVPDFFILLSETWVGCWAVFHHSNLKLTPRWDQKISPWWITPSLHQWHHGVESHQQHSHFGISFTIWDRLAGTWNFKDSQKGQNFPLGIK